jgi:putative Mn2+ efflux pump MntP
VVALVLTACAVGMSNFGAAVGLGLGGLTRGARVRVAAIFAAFEGGMPVIGVVLGRNLASALGSSARYVGGALLLGVAAWAVVELRRQDAARPIGSGRLLLTGFALSLDNLAVGVGLGVTRTPLLATLVVFAAVSAALTLAGLELGRRLGRLAEVRAELAGVAVLVVVGVLLLAGVL